MIRVGVVGYGYWGPHLARNFFAAPGATVSAVSDLRGERLEQVRRLYPTVKTVHSADEIFKDASIDAVAIATPLASHFDLGLRALKAGKHVLLEKPMAASVEECRRLIDEAAKRKLVLMVDHTFVYTGAVRKIKELVAGGKIGKPYYYDSVRVNLGLFQRDANVLWDLAVHDLAILDHVLGARPRSLSVTGLTHVRGGHEDIAYLACFFDDGMIAHLHASWLAPVKIRRTLIGGDRQMIVYDDLEPDEKIKIYDKGIVLPDGADPVYEQLIGYRTGDMLAPKLDGTEALQSEAAHFIDCLSSGKKPLTDGESGLRVVRVLEAADRSLAQGGSRVEIS